MLALTYAEAAVIADALDCDASHLIGQDLTFDDDVFDLAWATLHARGLVEGSGDDMRIHDDLAAVLPAITRSGPIVTLTVVTESAALVSVAVAGPDGLIGVIPDEPLVLTLYHPTPNDLVGNVQQALAESVVAIRIVVSDVDAERTLQISKSEGRVAISKDANPEIDSNVESVAAEVVALLDEAILIQPS